jgi:arabinofuranosyltransferase
MVEGSARTDGSNTRRLLAFAAAILGILLTLAGLTWLRRNAGDVAHVYEIGNVLDTHDGSGFARIDLERDLGRVTFALLAALVAVCARYAVRRELAAAVAGAASFALIFADSVARYATTLAGRVYVGMCDDALISMRYARNFAAGRGLVYNAGEWVDGYTNPLWTALMVVPHALGMHEAVATVPILALGGALLAAAALLSRAVLAKAGVELPLQILVALAIVFDASLFEFATLGLETPLVGMAAALVMYGGLRDRGRLVAVGLSVLTLARADGVVVAGLLVGWLVLDEAAVTKERLAVVARRHAKRALLVAGVAGSLVAWRFAIYGHAAPNTAYLKVYPLGERIVTGLASYGVRGVLMYGFPVAFVLWAAAVDERARRARRMLLPVVGVWLYSIYVGGDAFTYMRFFGPITPLLWTAVGLAAAAGWTRRAPATNAFAFVAIAFFVPAESERGLLGATWDRANEIREHVGTAKTLARNVPPGASVATFYAGLAYYAPTVRFVDVLGKTESHIAHEAKTHGAIPGHNKFDFAYVYGERRPEVTFTALSCDDVDRFMARPLAEREAAAEMPSHIYHAPLAQLLDPTFEKLYFPNRVVLRDGEAPAGHLVGCWFVREGAAVPTKWQLAFE